MLTASLGTPFLAPLPLQTFKKATFLSPVSSSRSWSRCQRFYCSECKSEQIRSYIYGISNHSMVSVLEIRFVPQVLNYLVLRISLKITIGEHDRTTFCSYFYVHNKLSFNLRTGSLFHYVKVETIDEPVFVFFKMICKSPIPSKPILAIPGKKWWSVMRLDKNFFLHFTKSNP